MMKIVDFNKDGLIDYKGRKYLFELSLYCIYSMYVNNILICCFIWFLFFKKLDGF